MVVGEYLTTPERPHQPPVRSPLIQTKLKVSLTPRVKPESVADFVKNLSRFDFEDSFKDVIVNKPQFSNDYRLSSQGIDAMFPESAHKFWHEAKKAAVGAAHTRARMSFYRLACDADHVEPWAAGLVDTPSELSKPSFLAKVKAIREEAGKRVMVAARDFLTDTLQEEEEARDTHYRSVMEMSKRHVSKEDLDSRVVKLRKYINTAAHNDCKKEKKDLIYALEHLDQRQVSDQEYHDPCMAARRRGKKFSKGQKQQAEANPEVPQQEDFRPGPQAPAPPPPKPQGNQQQGYTRRQQQRYQQNQMYQEAQGYGPPSVPQDPRRGGRGAPRAPRSGGRRGRGGRHHPYSRTPQHWDTRL